MNTTKLLLGLASFTICVCFLNGVLYGDDGTPGEKLDRSINYAKENGAEAEEKANEIAEAAEESAKKGADRVKVRSTR